VYLDSIAISYRENTRTVCQTLPSPDWPDVCQTLRCNSPTPFEVLSLQDQDRQMIVTRLNDQEQANEAKFSVFVCQSAPEAPQAPAAQGWVSRSIGFAGMLLAVKAFALAGRSGLEI
jgi:hypothetical protein